MNETLVEKMQTRLLERSKLLSYADETELESLELMFEQITLLGKVLHTAREYLDVPRIPFQANEKHYFDRDTLWLWERGLALPSEVESGAVSEMVQWYIREIHTQRGNSIINTLQRDIHTLMHALNGATPPFSQPML